MDDLKELEFQIQLLENDIEDLRDIEDEDVDFEIEILETQIEDIRDEICNRGL
jgi:hypothetical protein